MRLFNPAATTTIILSMANIVVAANPNQSSISPINTNYDYANFSKNFGESFTMFSQSSMNTTRGNCQYIYDNNCKSPKQRRLEALNRSFNKYRGVFPVEKSNEITELAYILSDLDFKDNLCEYNDFDESINITLQLLSGLTLRISKFIDDTDSLAVFSLYRKSEILVSDEMPLQEIVNTLLNKA